MSEELELRKALLSTDSGTTGDKLIPEVVSAGIRRFIEDRSPLYSIVPKRAWPTNTYLFREVNDMPTAGFLADGATMVTATVGTYAKPSVSMKYIYSRGEVTGPMIAAAGTLVDALQFEIELHAAAIARTLELTIIGGDETGTPTEFDGFVNAITQEFDASSAALTLSHMDTALDTPAEYPTHGIMSRAMGRRLWSLLQAQQRFIDRTEVGVGFRVPTYNDIPLIRVDNDADTDLATTILFPDMRHVVFPILMDVTYEPLAKTKDSDDFMLKMYCTLAVEGAARYHVKIINAATS